MALSCGVIAGVGEWDEFCLAASLSPLGHPPGVPRRDLLAELAPKDGLNMVQARAEAHAALAFSLFQHDSG
jgi:hypothetical protein